MKIYTDKYSKHFLINELELNIYKNIGINIKLAFKNMKDKFPEFGIRCNTDNINHKSIVENKIKIVHHDHCSEKIILLLIFAENAIYKLKIINQFLCIF